MNNKGVISNFFWRFLERCGAQGVTFIVSIVLARLLDPTVYGTVALVTVFTLIMQVFVDSGMGNALIQKKDADDLDFSTVFYYNIVFGIALYVIMFFASPLIASFYERPELTPIIRVMSLTLVISGVKNVQQAYVSKNMLFKRFFFATLGGTVTAAVVGITMAYMGLGIWALITQNLVNTAMDTAILWITVKWRPKKMFSLERLKRLFSFGWKLLVSSLLDTVYNELRQLIIGKKYSSDDLAFFNQGKQFPHLVVTNINSSIDSVLLPTLSKQQDDRDKVRSMTRRAIKTSTYLMMPLMMGLAVCAEPLVHFVLTDKWAECIPYLRIFCFTFAFFPIHTANLNAIKAMGRSDLFLKLELIKKAIGLAAIVISMWISVEAMAYSLLITTIISSFVNALPNHGLLKYTYIDQIKDMLPAILLSSVMGACVYGVEFLGLGHAVTLLIQVPLGVLIYVAGSKIFKLESFTYLLNAIRDILRKRKKKEKV